MKEDVKRITAFSLWEFCKQAEALIQEGYTFCDSVQNFPSGIVNNYHAGMVKNVVEVQPEVTKEEPVVKSKGRPVKAKE